MADQVVRLEKLDEGEWDGSDDDNVDFVAVFASGRRESFTAFTPRNVLRLMETTYATEKSFVAPFMLIVRRIDEECLRDAVEHWIANEERRLKPDKSTLKTLPRT